MRKSLIILFGVVSLALLVGVLWSFDRDLSNADRKHITAIVQAETTESILEIERQRDGTVQVSTGFKRDGNGGGRLLTLKRTFCGWKIVRRGAWVS
jgi:hypothetical protein